MPRRALLMVAAAGAVLLAACGGEVPKFARTTATTVTTEVVAPTSTAPSTTAPPTADATTAPSSTAAATAPPPETTAAGATTPPETAKPGTPPTPATAAAALAPVGSGRTSCQSVVHIGDSTSVGLISKSYINNPEERMEGQYARVGVANPVMRISGARSVVERYQNQANAAEVAEQLRAEGYQGCWVFALGTTDTANVAAGSSVSRPERIRRMMALAGNDPVLWVNVRTLVRSGPWSDPNMKLWNAALQEAAPSYPTLRVYDWAAVVQDDWFSDDTHYTSAGYVTRARLIADALAAAFPAPG